MVKKQVVMVINTGDLLDSSIVISVSSLVLEYTFWLCQKSSVHKTGYDSFRGCPLHRGSVFEIASF